MLTLTQILHTSNLSLYSIPLMWLIAFYPMNMKYRLIARTIGYNKYVLALSFPLFLF